MSEETENADREIIEKTATHLSEFFEDVLILVCKREDEDDPTRATRHVIYSGRGHHWARMGMCMQYIVDHSINSPKENNFDE